MVAYGGNPGACLDGEFDSPPSPPTPNFAVLQVLFGKQQHTGAISSRHRRIQHSTESSNRYYSPNQLGFQVHIYPFYEWIQQLPTFLRCGLHPESRYVLKQLRGFF